MHVDRNFGRFFNRWGSNQILKMDIGLGIKLSFSLFSLKRKNMRFFNIRRILVSLFLIPLFITVFLINRIFLLLDYVFFPHFLWKKIHNPVFIISSPRTATTFLYHKICADKKKITAFKLWEIVFAPSICQKYILLFIIRTDKLLGGVGVKIIMKIQDMLIGKLKKIHLIGLELPEEDEAVLLWNLSTVYLNFFFPDTPYFDRYFNFDDALPDKKRKRIMGFYKRCILRHCFVFDNRGEKIFLSKNPVMMSKVKSVAEIFPDAKILTINRCPSKTIPSTLTLNDSIYKIFTSIESTEEINLRTKNILINWYKMAHKNMEIYFPSALTIPFGELVNKESKTIHQICEFIGLSPDIFYEKKEDTVLHKSSNNYEELKQEEMNEIFEKLPFLSKIDR